MKGLGLYIHIPFCASKCKYCDFYSLPNTNETLREKYVEALMSHMEDYKIQAKDYVVTSIYFGGGTPSLLTEVQMKALMKKIRKCFRVSARCEISMEANPGCVDAKKLKSFRKSGINRISLGAQSFNDELLLSIGRIHKSEDIYSAVLDCAKAKIDNISLDLMFGLPGQTMDDVLNDIKCISQLNVAHVSLYGLKLEEGTPLWFSRNEIKFPSEDEERNMYFGASEYLKRLGYRQYEISNFSKKGRKCRHNLKYWNTDEYIGLGCGAHSYFGGKRYSFKKDIKLYIDSFDAEKKVSQSLVDEYIDIPPSARIAEYVMLRFRLCEGIDTTVFKKKFGRNFDDIYLDRIKPYLDSGHIVKTQRGYAFSPDGMYVSNYILSRVVDFDLVIPGSDS